MRYGIIAEGQADVCVIRCILKYLLHVDSSSIYAIRPREMVDETDNSDLRFSNWELVLRTCADDHILASFLDTIDEDGVIIVQIDTAERGEANYNIPLPIRTAGTEWSDYSTTLRQTVRDKIQALVPAQYQQRMIYAIAIEETDAWLIPIFDERSSDTASYVRPKERLQSAIGTLGRKKNKYIDANRGHLDYYQIALQYKHKLPTCRLHNRSLDLFCKELESIAIV